MNFDKLISQGYDFNIGRYISEGFTLFKKDIGGFIIATLLAIVMSFIPFCSLLAVGNFYKICKKVDEGQSVQAGDIFDFTDFWMYFKLFFLILLAVIILMIPVQITIIPIIAAAKGAGENINIAMLLGGMGMWFVLFLLFIFAFTVSLYFVQPIISLHKIQSVRQAYLLSWKIAKKNFFMILIFSIIVGIISQLGIIVCGVGLLFTAPIGICIKYISFKDVLNTQNQKAGLYE
ncbi:hypothetical protein [Chryseobacterium wangxinyae]|uniref:hypothetical protein n=1 Tax=Chryseobacterium sp. CY353 TaxID=2997334 RepID=UPI0022722D76|nr:hypothetical protein [Chryseobacterium sp. CY353]MCY0969726.1 hypothetical protein [Chryseobacterium sp. CY353]